GFDFDPPAGPSQVGVDAGQRIETRQCGTAMALARPRHHPQDAVLEDLPGQAFGKPQDLVVELLERPDLARAVSHASNVPRRPVPCTPGSDPNSIEALMTDRRAKLDSNDSMGDLRATSRGGRRVDAPTSSFKTDRA